EYYGQPVPLKQVAAISIPEARVLEIRPWDPAMLGEIEKAVQKSDIGITPQNDGKALRLNLPTMTEERRKDMVKVLGRMGEDCRVAVRNDRRDAIEEIKKAGKDKKLSEDQQKTQEAAIQKLTDAYVKKVDEAVAEKQKEISTL
ncbi:MAG: ribosome recycling factor, partial [Elusimicrobiota bacterium]